MGLFAPPGIQGAVMVLAVLFAVASIAAGLRMRGARAAATAVAAAATTFAVLTPISCGILQSHPPIASCRTVAGVVWRYRPSADSGWLDQAVLVTQLKGWGAAATAALICFAVFRVAALAVHRRTGSARAI